MKCTIAILLTVCFIAACGPKTVIVSPTVDINATVNARVQATELAATSPTVEPTVITTLTAPPPTPNIPLSPVPPTPAFVEGSTIFLMRSERAFVKPDGDIIADDYIAGTAFEYVTSVISPTAGTGNRVAWVLVKDGEGDELWFSNYHRADLFSAQDPRTCFRNRERGTIGYLVAHNIDRFPSVEYTGAMWLRDNHQGETEIQINEIVSIQVIKEEGKGPLVVSTRDGTQFVGTSQSAALHTGGLDHYVHLISNDAKILLESGPGGIYDVIACNNMVTPLPTTTITSSFVEGSTIFLTFSHSASEKPVVDRFSPHYLGGTEFEYVTNVISPTAGTGNRVEWTQVKDSNGDELWFSNAAFSAQDPRTCFMSRERGLVGYLVGGVHSDNSGGFTRTMFFQDNLLGEMEIQIRNIVTIQVNQEEGKGPLVVSTRDGTQFVGTSHDFPRVGQFGGLNSYAYFISNDGMIFIESGEGGTWDAVPCKYIVAPIPTGTIAPSFAEGSRIFLVVSAYAFEKPEGNRIRPDYVAGTEFEYVTNVISPTAGTGNRVEWIQVKDGEGDELWFSKPSADLFSAQDPRTCFRSHERGTVGYLLDDFDGDMGTMFFQDNLLGKIELQIRNIVTIQVDKQEGKGPLVVTTIDGIQFLGTTHYSPAFGGSDAGAYFISNDGKILIERAQAETWDASPCND